MRKPQTPPDWSVALTSLGVERLADVLAKTPDPREDPRYLSWDELRYRTPPDGLDVRTWWTAIRASRQHRGVAVDAMAALYRESFFYVPTARTQAGLHRFDRTNPARLLIRAAADGDVTSEIRVRQLIEEAISSSEIEGARPSTREAARALVREGREPGTRDERMILNNYRAMEHLLALRSQGTRLDRAELLALHRILGEGALEVEHAAGVFRDDAHEVRVADASGEIWHQPPPARPTDGRPPLEVRVDALLEFADPSRPDAAGVFVHPLVRAIVCHFWLGYEHPFRDGNGRMARALFYWVLLRSGYELAEFLSISGPIDRAPRAYYLAFAHTELDGGDLTYFVHHQIDVIAQAQDELVAHLDARARRSATVSRVVKASAGLGVRQRALLAHALENDGASYTIEGHARSHGVHYQTARADLLDLVARKLFEVRRVGSTKRFAPTASLSKKLARGR